jgi:uncharacterized protein (TIGR02099 family)
VAASLLLAVLVLGLRYVVLPDMERYRGGIVKSVSGATGMTVNAGALRAGWQGLRPYVELQNVTFAEPGSQSATPALSLPALHASLSWWSLFAGEIRFHEVTLDGPELALHRAADGIIYFAGKPVNRKSDEEGQLIPWLLEQPYLAVRNATLEWRDDLTGAPPLQLDGVNVRIEKSGARHRLGARAKPPADLARDIVASGVLDMRKESAGWVLSGSVFAEVSQVNLAGVRRHLPLPDAIREATGNVRAWIDIDSTQTRGVKGITADLNLIDVDAQFSRDLAPLELASLSGRVEYQSKPGGFAIASRALQFRTLAGIQVAPADFSLMLAAEPGKAPQGQAGANGIDLKVVAALINFFPVGKEMREAVARFAPRGMVTDAVVNWSGALPDVSGYRIKGQFQELGFNGDGKAPGVQGLSGSIEGDERGGKISIAAKQLQIEMGEVFRAPLAFDTLDAEGQWKKEADYWKLDIGKLAFANADAAGEVHGWYRSGGKGPGMVDLEGSLSRAEAVKVAGYLPNVVGETRPWLDAAIQAGKFSDVRFQLSGDLWDFPFKGDQQGKFFLDGKFAGARLKFLPDWPAINDIRGAINFSGARITVHGDSAAIYGSRIARTTAIIDDTTSWTPMLAIRGEVDAPAQDVSRYLIETPLVEGPGKFAQVTGMSGPGKLDLSLAIPLWGNEKRPRPPVKVAGRYHLQGVALTPPVGATVTNVTGAIDFTEHSVKSQELSGQVYGNPLEIAVSGGGAEGVVAELTGRADVVHLNDILPFTLPGQVRGIAGWSGTLRARSGHVDMVFRSDLVGVTSTLPEPLAKGAAQPLPLTAEIAETGQPAERISVRLGEAVFARFARRFDAAGHAAGLAGGVISLGKPIVSLPLPEGLWLVGDMRELDIDHWKESFGATGPASGTAEEGAASNVLSGFDLNVANLLAFGREFRTLQMKGRRAGDDWRLTVESPELSGDALWRPGAENGRGMVRARLKNFVLSQEHQTVAQASAAQNGESNFPALDIEAEKFRFRGHDLGKFDFKAAPDGNDWRIDKLVIEGEGWTLDTHGRWTRSDGPSRSNFNVKLEARNLNGLLRSFGHGDALRRGTGKLEGTLSWPGYPYQFALNTLSGEFKLEAQKGEFVKVAPGAGRLLGLISLQSLPRRLILDFRDVFSEGFAFDLISGTIRIDKGIMHTDDFEIVGTSAFVGMQGDVSLPQETQDLRLTVIPSLGGGVSFLAGLLVNPAVGVGALLLQKILQDPVGKAAAYQYKVTGTWDNPDAVPVERGTNGKTAPDTAAGAKTPQSQQTPQTPQKNQP